MKALIEKIIEEKQSRLCASLDVTTSKEFFKVLTAIAPYVCMVKTHMDTMEDFTPLVSTQLVEHAKVHNYLIFEDRKFADIGNTVCLQYEKGVHRIRDWAHIVNAHPVVGPGVLQALEKSIDAIDAREEKGVLLLAQMSAKGALIDDDYTKDAIQMARESPICLGFIGNGSDPNAVRYLRHLCGPDYLILTPGINLEQKGDGLSQQYGTPEAAIDAGADLIIVGRGIYRAEDPAAAAKRYQEASFALDKANKAPSTSP